MCIQKKALHHDIRRNLYFILLILLNYKCQQHKCTCIQGEIKRFSIIQFFFCSGEELTCWSGHDTSMSKQVCSPATTTPHEETGTPNGTLSDSEAPGKTYCYEMMYHESGGNSTLSFQKSYVARRLTHINASCDTELLCNSTNAWKSVQVCYSQYVSALFCHTCTTENFRSKMLLI